ncbi:hypothetical protein [Helicobacter pylori]|nr:hypothetical protein [Helicobacter pylori]
MKKFSFRSVLKIHNTKTIQTQTPQNPQLKKLKTKEIKSNHQQNKRIKI